MAELPIDIERIVQEVLRELRHALVPASPYDSAGATAGLPSSAADARVDKQTFQHATCVTPLSPRGRGQGEGDDQVKPTSSQSSPLTPNPSPTRGEGSNQYTSKPQVAPPVQHGRLTLAGRVVTLSALDGRLAGIHQLVVAPQAIVTPAVRDELRRRNVALCFAAPPANGSPASALLLALVVHAGASDAAQLVAALAGEPVVVRQENLDCVIAACERLAGVVANGRSLALLLTRHAAAAICLANRHQGVRAVLATDVAPTAASIRAIGANLLVADPVALGPARLKRIVLDYCRAGARPCPRVFQKELG